MNATKKTISQANAITSKYCHSFIPMIQIQNLYKELEAIGITTGLLAHGQRSCEWYLHGVRIENSLYVYSVYKSENSNNVEFTIYFS